MVNLLKRVLCTLFLILSSCSKQCEKWQFEEVISSCPSFSSKKLSLSPQSPCLGLEIELIYSQNVLKAYVNAFSLPFAPNPIFTLTINDEVIEATAYSFEGGQRLLLPQEVVPRLLDALWNGIPVTLTVGRYSSVIIPDNFRDLYPELIKFCFI